MILLSTSDSNYSQKTVNIHTLQDRLGYLNITTHDSSNILINIKSFFTRHYHFDSEYDNNNNNINNNKVDLTDNIYL